MTKFGSWLEANKVTLRAAGADLDPHFSYVHGLAKGKRTPSMEVAQRIVTYTKGEVPLEAWMQSAT